VLDDIVCGIRPDAKVLERNRLVLDATFLQIPNEDDAEECVEGPPVSLQRRREAVQYLLSIDNGAWSSDKLVHRCRYGCCRSTKESKLKLWVSLQDRDIFLLSKLLVCDILELHIVYCASYIDISCFD